MKQSSVFSAATAMAALAACPTAYAWGAAGHEIVATIAQVYLHPTTLNAVCNILYPDLSSTVSSSSPPCHLSRIAAWADQVRRLPKYRHTGPYHYVGAVGDHPSQSCVFPGRKGWAGHRDGNVLGAVRNTTNILIEYLDGERDRETAEEAIKFLVHYVGDMHMPLHLTGRERGGNGAKVTFDGRITNLHSLWDSGLIAQALRTIPSNYSAPFPSGTTTVDIEKHMRGAIYDPYVRRVMYEGLGVGEVNGRFEDGIFDWLLCPIPEALSTWATLQTALGIRSVGDETRWDDDVVCPYAWASELHHLNCDFPIWPAELDVPPYNETRLLPIPKDYGQHSNSHDDESSSESSSRPPTPHPDLLELDTPQYAGRVRRDWIVERLLAMAAVRLAGLLNGLFMNRAGQEDEYALLPIILPIIRPPVL